MLIYVYLIARYLLKNKPEIHFSKWKYFPKMKIFDEQRIEQENFFLVNSRDFNRMSCLSKNRESIPEWKKLFRFGMLSKTFNLELIFLINWYIVIYVCCFLIGLILALPLLVRFPKKISLIFIFGCQL